MAGLFRHDSYRDCFGICYSSESFPFCGEILKQVQDDFFANTNFRFWGEKKPGAESSTRQFN